MVLNVCLRQAGLNAGRGRVLTWAAGLLLWEAGAGAAQGQSCISWAQPIPTPRSSPAIAYDSARNVTVLFGGNRGGGIILRDTWEWDGTTWTQRSSTGPVARYDHTMVYDSVRGVTVLFGGTFGSSNLGDTWEWDGANWTQRSSSGPSARSGHAMVYDSARGVTVLSGGNGNGGYLGDTWEWDGATWTQRSSTGPSARRYHAMVYDSARGVTVLFGGLWNGNSLGDTWELRNCTPVVVSAVSRRTHGASPYDIDVLARRVECRGSPTILIVTFNRPIQGVSGLDPGDVTLSSGVITDMSAVGSVLTLSLSGVDNSSYLRVGFPGIASMTGEVSSSVLCVPVLSGDVTGEGTTNIFDLVAVRNAGMNTATNTGDFRMDVNADGSINIVDLVEVRNNLNKTISGSCP